MPKSRSVESSESVNVFLAESYNITLSSTNYGTVNDASSKPGATVEENRFEPGNY